AIEPAGTAGTSDAPNWSDIVIPIGTVLLATTVNASAWVGTNHAGRGSPLPSGSGTVVGLNASTGKSTSCGSRASTKTTFSLTPVLVTCTVTTTGCPAVRRADLEFGRLSTVIDAGAKSIAPVNDSWSRPGFCMPSARTSVHRPACGVARENCMASGDATEPPLIGDVDWMSSG